VLCCGVLWCGVVCCGVLCCAVVRCAFTHTHTHAYVDEDTCAGATAIFPLFSS
jgi:hypothetical protein